MQSFLKEGNIHAHYRDAYGKIDGGNWENVPRDFGRTFKGRHCRLNRLLQILGFRQWAVKIVQNP